MITDELLARHAAFWSGRGHAPLVGSMRKKCWSRNAYPVRECEFLGEPALMSAADFNVARLIGFKDGQRDGMLGDLINPVGIRFPEAWMEAFLGCPIYASDASCTARPFCGNSAQGLEVLDERAVFESAWFSKAVETVRVGERLAGAGEHAPPARQLHLRGVIDMLAAAMGETALCMEVYDAPDALGLLGGRYARLYADVARRLLEMRRRWRGGCVSTWKLYYPGELLDYQIDASSLFSKEQYKEQFLRHDEYIINQFEATIVHLHNCGLYHLESVLDIEKISAIEINLDRESTPWDAGKIIRAANAIQEAGKGVILVGRLNRDELGDVISKTDHRALAINNWFEEESV